MGYKNIKGLLIDAAKFPAAIEGRLPAGAPKLSAFMVDVQEKLPTLPDLPMEIPTLPEVPTLPETPELPGLKRYVTKVEEAKVPGIPSARPHTRFLY